MFDKHIALIEGKLTVTKAGNSAIRQYKKATGAVYFRNSEIDLDSVRYMVDTMPHPLHELQSGLVCGWVRLVHLDMSGVTFYHSEKSADDV